MQHAFKRFLADYGMLFVLILLCAYYSYATMEQQNPAGALAATQVAEKLAHAAKQYPAGTTPRVLIVAQSDAQDAAFAAALQARLPGLGLNVAAVASGTPRDIRAALDDLAAKHITIDFIAITQACSQWPILTNAIGKHPALLKATQFIPTSYRWPNFLKKSNLLAIADRIVVIAIIAIGMTLVIITGGIDLSVGSLIALSAVVATILIQNYAGAEHASASGMTLCCLAAILVCALIGAFSGFMITVFSVAPFIVTLATMLIASGMAFIVSKGQSVYQVPDGLAWLGRGASLMNIPNTVVLLVVLYVIAYVLMSHTLLGRYIYAVGGNAEASRLSGVPVKRVLLFVYFLCGALAGLGGIIQASQLKSGAPTYGVMYELYVIAAVAVGGTSLSGGDGRVLGTLIGAFIIAVIQNGMNLTGIESYTQKVVFGFVILIAVLIDMLKTRGWSPRALLPRKPAPTTPQTPQ